MGGGAGAVCGGLGESLADYAGRAMDEGGAFALEVLVGVGEHGDCGEMVFLCCGCCGRWMDSVYGIVLRCA